MQYLWVTFHGSLQVSQKITIFVLKWHLLAMVGQQYLNSIFAGDNSAFKQFYIECRGLFMAYFSKHYPKTEVPLSDLYQDSIMEFWSQIIDGKITEVSLQCSLSTYIISIGINKMREGYRRIQKQEKLVEALKKHPDIYRVSGGAKSPIIMSHDPNEDYIENIRSRLDFLKNQYEKLGYPCTLLLRYTWYNNMTDDDILKAFDGHFANTNSLKTKRFKCRKILDNMYKAWKTAQE